MSEQTTEEFAIIFGVTTHVDLATTTTTTNPPAAARYVWRGNRASPYQ